MASGKASKENQRLAALQRSEKPARLILSCYRFDSNRITDIIEVARKLGVDLTHVQAVRYAIRHCRLDESTAADFTEVMNEDVKRSAI